GALLAFDDDSGPGLCSRITQQLDAGTYFVEVHEFGDDSTLSYTLSYACTAPAVPEIEPNDTLATAQATGCGRAVQAAISPAGDVDWYSFTLDTTYRTSIVAHCSGDSPPALSDDSGTLLPFDDDSGPGFCSQINRTLKAGSYALEVHEFGDNGTI